MPARATHSKAPFILAEAMNDYEGHNIICARGVIAVTITEHATKISPEETANAWLFMAAPKLLEALEQIVGEAGLMHDPAEGPIIDIRSIRNAASAVALARTGKP